MFIREDGKIKANICLRKREGMKMQEDTIYMIVFFVIVGGVILLTLWGIWQGAQYMKKQKNEGTDKKKMMDAMAKVMQEKVGEYTYAVGNYTRTEQHGRTTTYYYYSYILAFNSSELVIFPFVVKDKELLLRNCLSINWNEVKFSYKIGKKGLDMTINMAGEKLIINVHKVRKSTGVENSAEPLGIYQEAEVERLITYLPQYKSYAGK